MTDWMDEVRDEDLPESHRKFADVIGTRDTLRLCEQYGGEQIYIPKNDSVRRAVRDRGIRLRYAQDGWTAKQIARRYGVTEAYVHALLSGYRPEQLRIDLGRGSKS